jgi:phospholipid transport system transporter-binding protein
VRGATLFTLDGRDGRFRLSGTAGIASARALLEAGSAAFGGEAQVELDLSGVSTADGAGLAVLLAWLSRARSAGRALHFVAIPESLLALARVCGVDSMLASAGART